MEPQDFGENISHLYHEGFNGDPNSELLKKITHLSAIVPKTETEKIEIQRKIEILRESLDSNRKSNHREEEISIN